MRTSLDARQVERQVMLGVVPARQPLTAEQVLICTTPEGSFHLEVIIALSGHYNSFLEDVSEVS